MSQNPSSTKLKATQQCSPATIQNSMNLCFSALIIEARNVSANRNCQLLVDLVLDQIISDI
jgi:hypothetical protein